MRATRAENGSSDMRAPRGWGGLTNESYRARGRTPRACKFRAARIGRSHSRCNGWAWGVSQRVTPAPLPTLLDRREKPMPFTRWLPLLPLFFLAGCAVKPAAKVAEDPPA